MSFLGFLTLNTLPYTKKVFWGVDLFFVWPRIFDFFVKRKCKHTYSFTRHFAVYSCLQAPIASLGGTLEENSACCGGQTSSRPNLWHLKTMGIPNLK
jgi:hypothetical protein